MYPLPVGLALVDMLAEHYEGRIERDKPMRRPLPRRRSRLVPRLVPRLGLRRRAIA
jgi:hypothetical protein